MEHSLCNSSCISLLGDATCLIDDTNRSELTISNLSRQVLKVQSFASGTFDNGASSFAHQEGYRIDCNQVFFSLHACAKTFVTLIMTVQLTEVQLCQTNFIEMRALATSYWIK